MRAFATCRVEEGSTFVSRLTDNQHELALKLSRVFNVGGNGVLRSHRPAHPLLVPPDLIHAVIMAPAVGDSSSIEFGMEEQGSRCVLAAGGISENPHSCDVIPGIFSNYRVMPLGCGRQNQRRPNFSTRHHENGRLRQEPRSERVCRILCGF